MSKSAKYKVGQAVEVCYRVGPFLRGQVVTVAQVFKPRQGDWRYRCTTGTESGWLYEGDLGLAQIALPLFDEELTHDHHA